MCFADTRDVTYVQLPVRIGISLKETPNDLRPIELEDRGVFVIFHHRARTTRSLLLRQGTGLRGRKKGGVNGSVNFRRRSPRGYDRRRIRVRGEYAACRA